MKVAEGSYGEVFKLEKKEIPQGTASRIPHRDLEAYAGCIFKLIPLRSKSGKSTKHTRLEALVREIQMLKRMDTIPGFVRFRDLSVLQGRYPLSFTEAHYIYKLRKASSSSAPVSYPEKQLWAMVEMDDAGKDLETIRTPSAYQIFDIFWMTCCALCYAEENAEFEVCAPQTTPAAAFANTAQFEAPGPPRRQHMRQIQHTRQYSRYSTSPKHQHAMSRSPDLQRRLLKPPHHNN